MLPAKPRHSNPPGDHLSLSAPLLGARAVAHARSPLRRWGVGSLLVGVLFAWAVPSDAASVPQPQPKPTPSAPPPAVSAEANNNGRSEKDAENDTGATTNAVPTPARPPLVGVTDSSLQDVERQLEQSRQQQKELAEQAKSLAAEVEALSKKLIAAASEAQDTEDSLSSLEGQLGELRQREKDIKAELSARNEQLREVLMALERIALRPPEAVLVQPTPPEDSVRSAILLRAAVPELSQRANALRSELEQLTQVRREISLRRTDIALAVAKLDRQHSTLATLFERKQALQKTTEAKSAEAARRADTLAEDANSMRELLAKLEAERKRREEEERRQREVEEARRAAEARRLAALAMAKPVPPTRPTSNQSGAPGASGTMPTAPASGSRPSLALGSPPPNQGGSTGEGAFGAVPPSATLVVRGPSVPLRSMDKMRGLMPLPARGKVVARYGQTDALGAAQKGLVLQTRPRAQVIAPADGVVAFAGTFRGYGQLLIMEHGGGYHTLLSGMGRIDATVGQRLLMGEPVGLMGSSDAPNLYFELRRDGQSINPSPWLTARKG